MLLKTSSTLRIRDLREPSRQRKNVRTGRQQPFPARKNSSRERKNLPRDGFSLPSKDFPSRPGTAGRMRTGFSLRGKDFLFRGRPIGLCRSHEPLPGKGVAFRCCQKLPSFGAVTATRLISGCIQRFPPTAHDGSKRSIDDSKRTPWLTVMETMRIRIPTHRRLRSGNPQAVSRSPRKRAPVLQGDC